VLQLLQLLGARSAELLSERCRIEVLREHSRGCRRDLLIGLGQTPLRKTTAWRPAIGCGVEGLGAANLCVIERNPAHAPSPGPQSWPSGPRVLCCGCGS